MKRDFDPRAKEWRMQPDVKRYFDPRAKEWRIRPRRQWVDGLVVATIALMILFMFGGFGPDPYQHATKREANILFTTHRHMTKKPKKHVKKFQIKKPGNAITIYK